MCNRYISPDEAEIERFWHIGRHNPWRWESEIYPRAAGPFILSARDAPEPELVVGQWGLIPWFAETAKLSYSTNNARFVIDRRYGATDDRRIGAIDGRPHFAKHSIDDGRQVKIAAIDPDFD